MFPLQCISIYGPAENCTRAVVKILEVIEAERAKEREKEREGGDGAAPAEES